MSLRNCLCSHDLFNTCFARAFVNKTSLINPLQVPLLTWLYFKPLASAFVHMYLLVYKRFGNAFAHINSLVNPFQVPMCQYVGLKINVCYRHISPNFNFLAFLPCQILAAFIPSYLEELGRLLKTEHFIGCWMPWDNSFTPIAQSQPFLELDVNTPIFCHNTRKRTKMWPSWKT